METNTDSDNSVRDELFCVKYELDLLSGQLTGRGLERWIEGFCLPQTHNEHVQRYNYASRFTSGRKVLDIACGTGRGSRILAESGAASHVSGYDISENAVRYASLRNRHPNVSFHVRNGLELDHKSEFDVIVCFETIEHLADPESLITRLAAAIRRDGILLISTPVSALEIDRNPSNPFHIQEWSISAFKQLLERAFAITKTHLQSRPFFNPTLLERVLAKVRWRPLERTDERNTIPLWEEFDAGNPLPMLRSNHTGYQILECSLR